MATDDELRSYAQMGMAAMLPGMEYALELMQRQINEMRAGLAHLQDLDKYARNAPKPKRRSSGWPDDPEERKKEMQRRQRVARKKSGTTAKKMSTAAKRHWDKMTPRQRKTRLAAMLAGRKKNKETNQLAA